MTPPLPLLIPAYCMQEPETQRQIFDDSIVSVDQDDGLAKLLIFLCPC